MEFLKAMRGSAIYLCGPVALISITAAALAATVSSSPTFVDLGVPGRASQTPTVAATGAFVAVVWSASTPDGTTDIYAAISHDSGRGFGAPVRVNSVNGDARVSGEQAPQVTIGPRASQPPAITVVWTSKGARGTTLLQSRSDDGGKSFARSSVVPGSDASGNRGWQATAVEAGGRVDALWLDHRELAADSTMAMSHHEHSTAADSKPDGVAMAQKSKLYVASIDGSLQPHAITGGVCYCCKTALVAGADGALYAAWRHVYPGNLRDMAFTVSRDGGKTFAPPLRVSEDKWMLEGCPDDGPSMAVDGQNRVHLAWPTLVTSADGEPGIGIFYASSSDARRFSAREQVPTEGVPHHPRIAVGGSGVILVWDEGKDGTRRIVMARRAAGSFKSTVISDGTPGVYPMAVPVAGGVVAVWTSGRASASAIRVARLP
jgi:hypothetical protein